MSTMQYGSLLTPQEGKRVSKKLKPKTIEYQIHQLTLAMSLLTELLEILKTDTRFVFFTAHNLVRCTPISIRYRKLTGIAEIHKFLACRRLYDKEDNLIVAQKMVIIARVTVHTLLNDIKMKQYA